MLCFVRRTPKSPPSCFFFKRVNKKALHNKVTFQKNGRVLGHLGQYPQMSLDVNQLVHIFAKPSYPTWKTTHGLPCCWKKASKYHKWNPGSLLHKAKKNLNCKTRALFLPVLFKLMRSHEWRLFNINKKAIKIT